jgi:hypothetical protein
MSAVGLALVPIVVAGGGFGGFAAARMRQTSPSVWHSGFTARAGGARMVTVIAGGDAGLYAAGPTGFYAAVLAALAAVFLIRRRTGRRA